MCRFPYLAVQLREDMRDGSADRLARSGTYRPRSALPCGPCAGEHSCRGSDLLGPVSRIASRRGLRVEPIEAKGGLARFGEGAHLVATFAVAGCACDWGASQHEALAALARDLLLAVDVRRVRLGLWTIGGDVDRADPHRPQVRREIDTDALAEVDWRADVSLEIRRAAHPPFPTRPLRKLSLAVE